MWVRGFLIGWFICFASLCVAQPFNGTNQTPVIHDSYQIHNDKDLYKTEDTDFSVFLNNENALI